MRRRYFTLVLLLRVAAPAAEKHLDGRWFRQALTAETEHWRKATSTPSGFAQPLLDRQWRPVGKQYGTLVSQSRVMFVMATGYEFTHAPAYLDALRKDAEFLLAHFRDTRYGGWFYSVDPEGKVLDDGKDAYGHAFVIFGLAHAARITHDERYAQAALETWNDMKKHLRDSAGFFRPRAARDWSQAPGTNSQNPMMHLFEALLALHDATRSGSVFAEAQAHAGNIFTKLFQDDGGYLPELYDSGWKPLPADGGGYVEVGHQFEWAFLLSHAVGKGFPKSYLKIGERLLAYGMKTGYDSAQGGIYSRGDYRGQVSQAPKGLWEQCEFLRTLMHYAALRDRTDLWPAFDKSLEFVKSNLIDPAYGGWFNSYDPKAPPERRETDKGSIWMSGYHVTGMYAEGVRLSSR